MAGGHSEEYWQGGGCCYCGETMEEDDVSEIFDGAVKRFKSAAESPVNIRVTVRFEPDAYGAAFKWARQRRYIYQRDGELGGMLLGALSAGVLPSESYDFDFEEEIDVDVEAE